jgi:hypothetical protein
MDTETFNAMHSRMEDAFAKYRATGFGLMATISSLSAGAIAGVFAHPDMSKKLALAFVVPIAASLLQQYCSYMGQRRHAESTDDQLEVFFKVETKIIEQAGVNVALEPASKKQKCSKRWYQWADYLCTTSVVSFILISFMGISNIACKR